VTPPASELQDTKLMTYRIVDGSPPSAGERSRLLDPTPATARTRRWRPGCTATAAELLVIHTLDAFEGDERVHIHARGRCAWPRQGVRPAAASASTLGP
jgi:hypothetical protein